MTTGERRPFAWREVGLVAGVLAVLLLAVAPWYGPHRDELYFASAGQRLAWGYPDQPSAVAVSAWLSDLVAPGSLVALRVPSVLAVMGAVLLTAMTARLLGGGRAAQVLTAVVVAFAVVTVASGHRLTTTTFEYVAWAGILYLAASALVEERPRQWLWAGLVGGVGLNAKHSVLVCLIGLGVGLLLTRSARHHLRSPWLWAGAGVALLLWLPNLWWQADHGWPVREISADINDEYGTLGGRLEYLLLPLVMFSPLMTPVWLLGLWRLLRSPDWAVVRPLAWVFVVTFVLFGLSGGKAYYLAPAIPVLLAAGCVVLTSRRTAQQVTRSGAWMVGAAVVAWAAFIPLLPAAVYAQSPYPAIDEDQLETIGWPEFAATLRSVVDEIPAEERDDAVIFTGNYGEAGAAEWYDVGLPVYSGHNGFGDWGPPPDDAAPVVVIGLQDPSELFDGCTEQARIDNDADADNEEQGMVVWLCQGPREPWSQLWPDLVHLDA